MSLIRFTHVHFAVALLTAVVSLPASALAQQAPTAPPPVKAVVVVQQTSTTSAPAPVAQTGAAPLTPRLILEAPSTAELGVAVTARATLVGPDGVPVTGVPVEFSAPANFLNTPGFVVLGHAVTDAAGAAAVEWEPRSDGSVTLSATFAGDKRFATAKATANVQIKGDQQLYQQQAGVVLPGLNAAPPFARTAALVQVTNPWPRLSGWPLVVALLIVWSLYFRAVTLLFTIARGRDPTPAGRKVA